MALDGYCLLTTARNKVNSKNPNFMFLGLTGRVEVKVAKLTGFMWIMCLRMWRGRWPGLQRSAIPKSTVEGTVFKVCKFTVIPQRGRIRHTFALSLIFWPNTKDCATSTSFSLPFPSLFPLAPSSLFSGFWNDKRDSGPTQHLSIFKYRQFYDNTFNKALNRMKILY